ncbi:hypothetical protein BaRGS_00023839 [Batillaria attramentaria]|uniref:Uncharacterized protein n=1 Tax=Batillaria attramentaria TaxID=370345 RepID=A0ABD0KCV1_9CAEN
MEFSSTHSCLRMEEEHAESGLHTVVTSTPRATRASASRSQLQENLDPSARCLEREKHAAQDSFRYSVVKTHSRPGGRPQLQEVKIRSVVGLSEGCPVIQTGRHPAIQTDEYL